MGRGEAVWGEEGDKFSGVRGGDEDKMLSPCRFQDAVRQQPRSP